MDASTEKTLDLFKEALSKADETMTKAWTQNATSTQGLQIYNLEAPSKKLFPVLTPLRNRIGRVGKPGGNAVNWKGITALDSALIPPGVSEGNRNAAISTTVSEFTAPFRGLGQEDYVTFEVDYAGQGFEDIRALAAENLLKSLMIAEEKVILWGNGSDGIALGTTPTPTLAAATGTGPVAGTYSVICVALTYQAYVRSSLAGGVVGTLARTNVDGSSDTVNLGAAQKSANATTVTSGGNLSLAATVAAVPGAVAYAWYFGAAASERLIAITTVNKYTMTATSFGSNQLASALTAADYSKDSLVFTGIASSILASGSGAYVKSLDGVTLTADQAGGIVEIEDMIQTLFDNKRLQPDLFLVSSRGARDMLAGVLKGGSAPPAFRLEVPTSGIQAGLQGGVILASYLGKYGQAAGENGGAAIPIMVHPNMPPGIMFALSFQLPYPVNGVPSTWQMATRQEYYAIEWPRKSRKYEYGVYVDELLQSYAPFAHGCIYNIGNGIA